MGKSFHSRLQQALDAPLQKGERIDTSMHYKLKRAMRDANMRGQQFQNEEELAAYLHEGRRYQ